MSVPPPFPHSAPRSLARPRPLVATLMLSTTLLLSACSNHRPRMNDEGPRQAMSEKTVMHALSESGADDAQRRVVLDAFDQGEARRKSSMQQADELRRQIARLQKASPDYLTQIEPLLRQQGALQVDQSLAQAGFEHRVATTLTPEQLERWNEALHASQDREGGPGGGGGRRGRGPGGGGPGGGGPGGGF